MGGGSTGACCLEGADQRQHKRDHEDHEQPAVDGGPTDDREDDQQQHQEPSNAIAITPCSSARFFAVLRVAKRGTQRQNKQGGERKWRRELEPREIVRGRRSGGWEGRRTVWFPLRQDYTSETKPFFLTSEFLVFILYMMGLGIAASTSASIDARLFWILATAATFGYMLSRGLAKAGSRSRAHDPREDFDLG